jgi:UDP-N-acetylglucosamine 2-epimerase (non-hydrolysing)
MHPRTRKSFLDFGLSLSSNVRPAEPFGYLDFLKLMANSRLVLTDSGGIQEETTILGVPCLTLRENTERPATVLDGTNTLVGLDKERIVSVALEKLATGCPGSSKPGLWDGKASQRIVAVLKNL